MSRNPEVALTLRARDEASRPVARAMQDLTRQTQTAEKAVIGLSRESKRFADAREILGVRSEQAIQREIRQTEAAYQRLATAGVLSGREQARAYEAMRDKVKELRREMKGVSRLQKGMVTGVKGVAAGVAGVTAGGYVVAQPVKRTMDYDRRLAMMANTAYADRDIAGRLAGKTKLAEAVQQALRIGGGNKEGAAETLDNLIASGSMSSKTAMNLLPTLQKYATASGADPNELGNIAIRAMQTFKIKESELPLVLDMAIKAGQAGGFELKDMSKWLPQQMAAAKQSGMSGMPGLAKLLAVNQAAVITAGTKDEAGNNVVNLLAKINSQDTAHDAAKISSKTFQEKKKGEKGIDLAGTLAAARAKGVDSLDAFVGLVDKVVAHDKRFQEIQAKLKTAKGDDRTALLEAQGDILQGSAIGKLIQDRQAMMALVGYMGNRDYVKEIERQLPGAAGTGQTNFDLIAATPSFQMERAKNEKDLAEQSAFDGLSSTIGSVAEKLADYAQKYPGLSIAVVAATTTVSALAAAAGAAALPLLAMRGAGIGAGAAAAGGAVASGTAAEAAGGAAAGGAMATGARLLGKLTPLLALVTLTQGLTPEEEEEALHGDARWKKIRAQYSQAQIDEARKRYQPWYQVGEGYAAENENWLAQLTKDNASSVAKRAAPSAAAPIPQLTLAEAAVNASTKLDAAATKLEQATSQPIPVKVTVDVQNGNIVAAVNQANAATARRH